MTFFRNSIPYSKRPDIFLLHKKYSRSYFLLYPHRHKNIEWKFVKLCKLWTWLTFSASEWTEEGAALSNHIIVYVFQQLGCVFALFCSDGFNGARWYPRRTLHRQWFLRKGVDPALRTSPVFRAGYLHRTAHPLIVWKIAEPI